MSTVQLPDVSLLFGTVLLVIKKFYIFGTRSIRIKHFSELRKQADRRELYMVALRLVNSRAHIAVRVLEKMLLFLEILKV